MDRKSKLKCQICARKSLNERFERILYYVNDPTKGIRIKPNNLSPDEVKNLFDEVFNELISE